MPRSAAILICVTCISIISFLAATFIMPIIVKNIFTFVKKNFMIKKEAEIKAMLGRQVKRFFEKYVRGGRSPTTIARAMRKDFPHEDISKQYIEAQFKSPSWTFILWLEKKHKLNLEWLIKGEEDNEIPILKI